MAVKKEVIQPMLKKGAATKGPTKGAGKGASKSAWKPTATIKPSGKGSRFAQPTRTVQPVRTIVPTRSFGKGNARAGKGAPPTGGPKGGGQWVFVPAGKPLQSAVPARVPATGLGKGGKGKGAKGNQDPKQKANLDKLTAIEADKKVWIGGLHKEVTRGKLFQHIKEVVKPKLFELMNKGTACVSFENPEDAELVISSLNGSELMGKAIEVDVWTQKEKKERPEKTEKTKSGLKTNFLKKKKNKDKVEKSPVELKMEEKSREVDASKKIHVGGMSAETTWKTLKAHFKDNGCDPSIVSMMRKAGTACLCFKTEEDASAAVALDGSELEGSDIVVNMWQKK